MDDLKDSATGNKMFLDGHVSKIDGITTDLKRKWQDSFTHAETSSKENADFTAAKHCRIELLMQKWLEFFLLFRYCFHLICLFLYRDLPFVLVLSLLLP